jgi:hypothetical protein
MNEHQCKHLEMVMDAYDEWYLCCSLGKPASEGKCQKELRKCELFERRR